ncbi:MFS transporter [Streptomyces sp. NPDC048172]|uniref:MFS transporter n=1 Tax=Streptomyces sp. NPDC048172 TaxID=3365505 RepID=UPI0037215EE7
MAARQRLPRTVWLLVVARAVNRLGAFSLSFLTVLMTTAFGASAATAGIVAAAFGVATIPSRLAGGRLADRLGRRRTLVLGLVGCAAAQAGIAAAPNLATAAVCAVLLGLAFELYEPPSQAIIADAVGAEHRVRAYSLLNAALAVAGMGAGLLAAGLGRWDLRWLFVADAATCLLCALVMRLALPDDRPGVADTPRGPAPRPPHAPSGVAPWRDRALLSLLASGTFFALAYLQVMAMLPLTLERRGLQAADAGLLLTVSAVTVVAGQPALRRGPLATLAPRTAFASGYLLLALGLAGYAAAGCLPLFALATVVWSVGDLLVMGRLIATAADLAPPGGTGRYLAVYGTSWGIASVAAPLLGTQLLQHAGTTTLWLTTAVTCAALATLQPAVARTGAFGRLQGQPQGAGHGQQGSSGPPT